MNFWDQRYSGPGYKYGTDPNTFLREQAVRLTPPADVLVPGDGEGRNGVWLAQQGHRVTAVDYSATGLQKARELTVRHSVALTTVLADLGEWSPTPAAFDVVVLIYTHLPGAIRHAAHRRLALGLRPGGWLVLEAFHPAQLASTSGGPKDLDMLYTAEMLASDFSGLLAPVLSWEGDTALSEGPGHQGLARVTRWVGRRQT